MKKHVALLLSTAGLLHAGSPDLETTIPAKPEPWIKPVIDIRARYEFADIDGFDKSNAFTTRERLGLQTQQWNGLSVLVEGEFTQAVVDDYNAGVVGADPFNPTDSVIGDPESNELNQGYLQYNGFDTMFRAGRQRIIYDNAAFIGNVGWRQNEQTYDAISLENKSIDDLTLKYAYIGQVNRIAGSEATLPNVGYVNGDVNLFNANYTGFKGFSLTGYSYIMNFQENSAWDNNTFGGIAKTDQFGLTLYGEVAFQDHASLTSDGNAWYGHGTVTKAFGPQSLTVGVESLGAGFKSPLATLHAFNGFADAFVGGRMNGSQNGLTDCYVTHTLPIFWGMKWVNALHAYGDNEVSAGYGWEVNSVLVKKFNDNFTALAKLAYFDADEDPYVGGSAGAPLPDTTRISIEMGYTF
ncbi:MAG: hypothetical protein V4640_05690 [Verrucomicrobiota bacterium]